MKLAICVYTSDNSAKISPSFATSHYFFIYDVKKELMVEKITNHFRTSIGAEVFCAQLLIKRGINTVVCEVCEDDAKKLFSEANVRIIENININPGEFLHEFYKQYRSDSSLAEFAFGLTLF